MFKLISKIIETKEVGLVNNKISYVQNKRFFIGSKDFEINPMLFIADSSNERVWIKDEMWGNYLLKLKENKIEKLNYNIGLNGIITNYITVFKDNTQSILNTETLEIVMSFPEIEKIKKYFTHQDNLILLNDKNIIKLYTLPTANPLWKFALADLGNYFDKIEWKEKPCEVAQFLGVYNEVLWVQLKGQKLLGLDLATGKQLHLLEDIPKGYGDNYLDTKTGVVHILAGHSYREFDLNTLSFKVNVNIDPNQDFSVRSATFYKNSPQIFFCGRYKQVGFANCFGVYDTQKQAVVWFKTSETEDQHFSQAPQFANHKLYVLDSKHTLHIYEEV